MVARRVWETYNLVLNRRTVSHARPAYRTSVKRTSVEIRANDFVCFRCCVCCPTGHLRLVQRPWSPFLRPYIIVRRMFISLFPRGNTVLQGGILNIRDAVFYDCGCVALGRLLITTFAARTSLDPQTCSAARPHIHGTTTPISYALPHILFPRGNSPARRSAVCAADITTLAALCPPGHILGMQSVRTFPRGNVGYRRGQRIRQWGIACQIFVMRHIFGIQTILFPRGNTLSWLLLYTAAAGLFPRGNAALFVSDSPWSTSNHRRTRSDDIATWKS